MKFRKKPVVIDAIIWNGQNLSEVEAFCEGKARIELYDAAWKAGATGVMADVFIDTLEGTHHASPGDYIIKGVHGEFYPCKPNIFQKTYEKVNETGDGINQNSCDCTNTAVL